MGEGVFGEGNWAVTKGTTTLELRGKKKKERSSVLKETRMIQNERNERYVSWWADLESVDNFFTCHRCYTILHKSPESPFCSQIVTNSSDFFLSVLTSGMEFDLQKGESSSQIEQVQKWPQWQLGFHTWSACCCYVFWRGRSPRSAVAPALLEQPS